MSHPSRSCEIAVRVTPRASKNAVSIEAGMIKIRVTSPPVDGEANKAVVALLARMLGISASRVEIVRGATSREKRVAIEGLDFAEAMNRLSGGSLF